MKTRSYWAAKTDETNRLEGRRVRLKLWWWKAPKYEHGKVLMLFDTRRQCRAWINAEHGYIRRRPDLQREPHCWRVPIPVRVEVKVREL